MRRIKRFANALIDGVPVRDKDRPGSDVDLLDWLRQCRRAGLYEQGRAMYEKGGLNPAHLTDEQQIEAEDDYRICALVAASKSPNRKSGSVKCYETTTKTSTLSTGRLQGVRFTSLNASEWRSKIHIVQCPSLAFQACCKHCPSEWTEPGSQA